jgi:hypothetical protein
MTQTMNSHSLGPRANERVLAPPRRLLMRIERGRREIVQMRLRHGLNCVVGVVGVVLVPAEPSNRACGDGWGGRWRCRRPGGCDRCTGIAVRGEYRRVVAETRTMPALTRWVPWSVVAGVTDRPRDLPGMCANARIHLRNRVAWAREARWWRETRTWAWAGIAVLDGEQMVAADAAEADRVEAVAGSIGRAIGVVLYGLTGSTSPLVDPGGVKAILTRGRSWSGPGQVEAGEPVSRADLPDAAWHSICTAWSRNLDADITTVLATGRGWQSLRYRAGPAA